VREEIYLVPVQDWSPYALSNDGKLHRVGQAPGAKVPFVFDKPRTNRNGYEYVILRDRGRKWCVEIHVLMALHFLGPRPKGKVIGHIDGNKTNNRPENLRYITQLENMRHAAALGKLRRGENHPHAQLTERSVKAIRRKAAKGVRVCEIAKQYPQVGYNAIYGIVSGQNWKHLQAA
jgi:hypothetical protein